MADGIADLPSGMDVDLECESGYYFHRYSVDLSGVKRFGGQTIWVHGINNYGGISVPVWNSGAFTVPEPVGAPAPPTGLTLNVGIDIITGQEIHGVSFTPVPGIQYYRISALRGDTAEHTEFLLTTTSAGFGAQPLAPMRYRVAACYAASASTCGMYSAPVDR